MNSITKKILLYFLAASTIIVSYSSARSVNFSDRAYSFLTTSDSLLSISRTSLINKIDNEAVTNSWADVVELSELVCLSSGKGVTIAIIDSGIDIYNPMFNSLILSSSWNFADSNSIIMDQNGHGTNVSGIIVQFVPDIQLMILKINHADAHTFYTEDVVNAIYYAVENGADIINMSLSLAKESISVKNAVSYAIEQGVIVVAAAGNNASDSSFPGSINEVITVGATTSDGSAVLWNSPESAFIDITAPGKYIQTVGLDGDMVFVTGSSFSTSMVSGAIAALLGMNPYLKPSTVENILFYSSKDMGTVGKDNQFGWGLLSGSGINQAVTPSIRANKILSSNHQLNSLDSLPDSSFEISCYLPPTDIYTDVYIALVKYKESNKRELGCSTLDIDCIWWLASNGIWKDHKDAGIISVASLLLDSIGVDILLFSDSGGVWENFSSARFGNGCYKFGIALMRDFQLIAPIFWSPTIAF